MSLWSQFGLQEGITITIELINYFHDYIIILLSIIIVYVGYVFFISLLSNRNLDRFIVDSHFLEFIWTLIPLLFLFAMALPSLYLLYFLEDESSRSLDVKVVGHQWYWEYEYYNLLSGNVSFNSYMLTRDSPDSYRLLDVDNRLCLPSNSTSLLMVTSADVLHSWTVPSLGVKADATPGRLNYLSVTPTSYGVFYGQCSELCGTNHSFIPIVVEVTKPSFLLNYINSLMS